MTASPSFAKILVHLIGYHPIAVRNLSRSPVTNHCR
jgi:hypothetical protein